MDESSILLGVRDEDQSFHVRYRMEASCLELALEGERLCKAGDYRAGVSFFEAAIQVGTEDLQILSAIYSQLGNAFFHLHDYAKALEYHHHDLTLTRAIGDQLGEAKASGNLGNTLKVLGRFDEAAACCQKHLDISRSLKDKVGQARALYNFGNVHHAQGKNICWSGTDPREFPEEAMASLRKAAEFYEDNLLIVNELRDRAAQGRTYGNLGNTYYLLGNFQSAIEAHEQRLLIAKEFGDRMAERRAYCNLGNAHIFLGQFEVAAEHYKRTLLLARLLRDRAVEAQACYSLGNTYTLLQDYERAIDYHLKHLTIAQDLNDRLLSLEILKLLVWQAKGGPGRGTDPQTPGVGEGRACWSLGNAYTALGNHDQAMHYAEKHLKISREIGDQNGEMTARMNVSDLQMALGLSCSTMNTAGPENHETDCDSHGATPSLVKRDSMESLELEKMTPGNNTGQNWNNNILTKQPKLSLAKTSPKLFFINRLRGKKKSSDVSRRTERDSSNTLAVPKVEDPKEGDDLDVLGDEGFFDLLSRFQSNRMDDQRCSVQESRSAECVPSSLPSLTAPAIPKSHSANDALPHHRQFLDMVATSQSRRLEDQRASAGNLPGLRLSQHNSQSVLSHLMASSDCREPDEEFFDMLVRCQGSRLDDQRCAAPPPAAKGPTVPDEDFFSLILRSQAKRMDEQRVPPPPDTDLPNPD